MHTSSSRCTWLIVLDILRPFGFWGINTPTHQAGTAGCSSLQVIWPTLLAFDCRFARCGFLPVLKSELDRGQVRDPAFRSLSA